MPSSTHSFQLKHLKKDFNFRNKIYSSFSCAEFKNLEIKTERKNLKFAGAGRL